MEKYEELYSDLNIKINNIENEVKNKQDDVVSKFENLERKVNNVEVSDAINSKKLTDSIKEKALWLIVSGILIYILSQMLPQIFK